MHYRPLIGITMRLEMETRRFYLGRDYSEAIEAAGGIPVHLGLIPKKEYISNVLRSMDGILLPGSNTDVDPYLYGQEPHPRLGTVIPEKDQTEMLVLDEIEQNGLPLLAICYGMQALNVSRGGTLTQDIESQRPAAIKHEQGMPHTRHSHSLTIDDSGLLASINSANGVVRVNSSHHQAVEELGRDLRPVAWANDGVIECIEDTRSERFVLGVQWHPEMTTSLDTLSSEIFDRFVKECSMSGRSRTSPSDIRSNDRLGVFETLM
jgi:putative glutamine amidotransferase